MLNGYEFWVWTPIKHNGKFSHYNSDRHVVHAETEQEARDSIHLEKGRVTNVHEGFVITVEDQFIYSVRCLGRVIYKTIVEYEP